MTTSFVRFIAVLCWCCVRVREPGERTRQVITVLYNYSFRSTYIYIYFRFIITNCTWGMCCSFKSSSLYIYNNSCTRPPLSRAQCLITNAINAFRFMFLFVLFCSVNVPLCLLCFFYASNCWLCCYFKAHHFV